MTKHSYQGIFLRYLILLILAMPGFYLFYFIFTNLTLYSIYFLFKGVYSDVFLSGATILVSGNFPIEIIGACVGGSAYSLLTILNLATPKIKINKRLKMLFISYLAFLIINIMRIFVLGIMFIEHSSALNIAHKLFWYLGSTVFVIAIWFGEVKYFKIKSIPFYSDMQFLIGKIKQTKKSKRSK